MSAFLWSSESSSTARESLALRPDEREAIIGFLRRLVQTPSVSKQESALADLIIDELRSIGIEDIRLDRAGNVIAQIGNGDGPLLLLDAHMDTVEPTRDEWPYNPYAGHIDERNLYGLGTADMKGAIASIVYGVKRLLDTNAALNGKLVLAFVVQQEPCEGCAIQICLEELDITPDYVLLCEPSDMRIMRGHRGRAMFKVSVKGRSSHASNPDMGRNAITAAARLIFGIDLVAVDLPSDPFLGPGTIAVTHIESHAASLNAIPDTCTFFVDRRLTLGETPTRAQTQIEAVIQREGIDARIEVLEYQEESYTGCVIHGYEAFTAWALDRDHKLIQWLEQSVNAITGSPPEIGHWPFSTDGVYTMSEAGIPTAGFGPGNPNLAHTAQEHINLDDVILAAQIYALFTLQVLN